MRTIQVKVRPNARASVLEEAEDGTWHARLNALPVGGKANLELIRLVATHFGCPKSGVSIKRGASSRIKWLEVDTD